jgi:hypothetical protein
MRSVLQAEADFESDLPVVDLALVKVTSNFVDLEPVEVANRLAGSLDCVSNGCVDAILGSANDFGDSVDMTGHWFLCSTLGNTADTTCTGESEGQ